MELKFQILYEFFLESNNENDTKLYTRVNQKKKWTAPQREFFYILSIEKIANKSWSNIEMEKNSSCSRVLAWLVVHRIAELQLTAPLQKSATKFFNQAPIFPPDSL